MSVIWSEGWEHYGTGATGLANSLKGLWSVNLNNGIGSSVPRTGTYYLDLGTNTANARRGVGTRTQLGMAFGLRFPSLPSAAMYWFAMKDVNNDAVLTLLWMTDGAIQIRKGNQAGALLDQTEAVITAGTWHHVEAVVTISSTVGMIELRVDGIVQSVLTDLNLGSTPITQVAWESSTGFSTPPDIDDIVAHTGDEFIGPARVHTLFIEADGSPFGDWVITGADTGAEAVDELVPDGDTSYITAENEGDVARFLMPTLPVDVNEITGIHIPVMARQNEAGLTRIQTTLISAAEAVDGSEHAITPAYSYVDDAFSVDPATGEKWNRTSFEAATLEITRTV